MRRKETLIRHILFMLKGPNRNTVSGKSSSKADLSSPQSLPSVGRPKKLISKPKKQLTTKTTRTSVTRSTGISKFHVKILLVR